MSKASNVANEMEENVELLLTIGNCFTEIFLDK